MKQIPTQYAAYIGLDWADQEHAYALQRSGSSEIETGQVKQTPEALQSWIRNWAARARRKVGETIFRPQR